MKERRKHTQENRKKVVVGIDMARHDSTSLLAEAAKRNGINTEHFWVVHVETRHGSLPSSSSFRMFEHESDAKDFFEKSPVGSEQKAPQNLAESLKGNPDKTVIQTMFDNPNSERNILAAGGGDDGLLTWETTKDAGLNDGIQTSPKVLDFLGEERVAKIKSIHKENWDVAAEMEYCFLNLPSSSSGYVATQKLYNLYIRQDDFSAGYLQRDLEILVFGVEEAAQRANEFSKRQAARALKGGEAVAQKAELRRTTFFRIALANVTSWVGKSENEQRRFLKNLASEHDKSTGQDLFKHGTKALSDQWFDDMLSSLRQSGEIEVVLTKKTPGLS